MTNHEFHSGVGTRGGAVGEKVVSEQSRLNVFAANLAGISRAELFREKWLIAPSLRVGHQWLDTVARAGCPVLNCRIKTLKGMALELAGPEMARRGASLVSSTAALVIVDGILCRLPPSAYLAGVPVGPGLCKTVLGAINGMRLAGVTPSDLHASCFEEPRKADDLTFIFSAYNEALQAKGLLDYAAILELATVTLRHAPTPLGRGLVMIPENQDFSAAERVLVESLPATDLRYIPVDRPALEQTAGECHSDLALLRWLSHPALAPAACDDGTVSIFHAVGEVNEVREVLRRCLTQGHRLDQVELLHTDAQTYVPLIYETFLGLLAEGERDRSPLPVTFAEGIPTTYSRPGRALMGWTQWMRENFLQTTLCRMLEDGLLNVPGTEGSAFSFAQLTSLLREVPIGWGRERYADRLDELVSESSQRSDPAPADELSATPDNRGGLQRLRMLIEDLLETTPHAEASQTEVLQAAAHFLAKLARTDNEADNYSRQALVEKIDDMALWIEKAGGTVCLEVRAWLEALPGEIWVEGSGPRPGRLHVANVASGGMSGREHTFIIGLDDGRFPAGVLNDPLLLDSERGRLSPELPTAPQLLSRKLERFTTMLAGLRGTVTFGLSSLDLASDRAAFPSPVVFSAFRLLSENRDADQTDLMRWLGVPASFAPAAAAHSLDETEWWLWRLCVADRRDQSNHPESPGGRSRQSSAQRVRDGRDLVERRFPHHHRARAAMQHRQSMEFTIYDGKIPDSPADLDPMSPSGPLMSAAGLETVGQCPLRYFFRYVLGIKPPQELVPDPARWLEGAEFGELLHEVFYQFMSELLGQRRLPLFERDMGRLTQILDDRVQHYARIHPPYSASAFRQQDMQLLQAARIFLKEEEVLCRTHRPMFLEVSLGMRSARPAGPLDTPEPVSVALEEGRSIRVRGRLDRIDRTAEDADAAFAICDYKTGSDLKYTQVDPFWEGRVIQHALYLAVASAVLRRKISRNAKVAYFEFFFPNARGRGRRIRMPAEQAESATRVIDNLCRIVAGGCFLATTDFKVDCAFCDYRTICGDVEASAHFAALKLENSPDPALEPLRELRTRGKRSSR